ncbi:hypothetical protein [Mesorhizobium sp. BE184]|uniref:hypothetical protein n=1 Tax=Mesorhizobium sp. BE184 TaxID=2817714 RepID=UPI002865A441|nr:hypothetical protein [Mesorhizobium sp. BE184]MDR7034487.1 hypothetical protein [Mesorhizobium sp. BE184]
MTKALTFVEIDIPYCALSYGVGACPAVLGVDSDMKCFNSPATCPVRPSFVDAPVTLRFAVNTAYLAESGIDAIGCIEDVSFTPGTVSLGKDLGTRASLRITMSDFPWGDAAPGFDKYLAERPYDPFKVGTFWGKFRARQPYLRSRPLRIIQGILGQTLADMETRHFLVESLDGPTKDNRFSIIAKDALKLADGDRAQAPVMSRGFLFVDIDEEATSAQITPAGIGDIEYPATGIVAIGGSEICSFTRTGDMLTLVRGQFNTEAASHSAGDRVQICIRYLSQDPADILADLLINYAGVPADYIPLTAWKTETTSFLRNLYTALIAEPTSVSTLAAELVEQGAFAVWWDDINKLIKLQVLRQIGTDVALFSDDVVMQGSLTATDQPDRRISQVWTYFAQINALKKVDDADNYRSCSATVDLQAEGDYGSPAIKKIYSRWIGEGGRAVANRVNDIQIGRFGQPPRKFKLDTMRGGRITPILGAGYKINARTIQDATGARIDLPAQITKLDPKPDRFGVELEEFRFTFLDLDGPRAVIFDLDTYNINARSIYDQFYPAPEEGDEVKLIVEEGVTVGSRSTDMPAMNIGDWPVGVIVRLIIRGRIQGRGGDGGNYRGSSILAEPGKDGGDALLTRSPIVIESDGGEIFGGGGGGGGNNVFIQGLGGGGGAGFNPGEAGAQQSRFGDTTYPQAGKRDAGGAGGTATFGGGLSSAGAGGGPGLPGEASGKSGGAAGTAIDGISFVTFDDVPDIRGPQIN